MLENTSNPSDSKSRYPDSSAPDARLAANFLMQIANHGPITVVTVPVNPKASLREITFDTDAPGAEESMRSFIAHNETLPHQVFYIPNRVIDGADNRKRESIGEIRTIVLDFDPDKDKPLEEERMRLRGIAASLVHGPVQPRFIVDSGGGMQVGFQLLAPIAIASHTRDEITRNTEDLMKRLSLSLGAATHTCTIQNCFRVPGTKNWPTPAKKRAGREVSVSGLWFSGGPRTSLEELQALCTVSPADIDATRASEAPIDGLEEADVVAVLGAPERLPGRLIALLQEKPALAAAVKKPDINSDDRSGDDYSLCETLARHRLPARDIALLLSAYGAKVHETLQQERLFSYVCMTVNKAVAEVEAAIDLLDPDGFDEAAVAREQAIRLARLQPLNFEQAMDGLFDEHQVSLVEGLMERQQMTVVYGQSGAGKTFVVLDIAYRVSLGLDWHGHKTRQCAVIYIAAESPRSIRFRMKALGDAHGASDSFFLVPAVVNLFDRKADLKPLIDKIADLKVDVGLIVVDTLARTMIGGNENSTQDMSQLVANGDILRDRFRCNVLWVHHTGKDESRGARGSSALRAATDTEIEIADHKFFVTKLRDDEPFDCAFGLKPVQISDTRSTCLVDWQPGTGIGNGKDKGTLNRDAIIKILRLLGVPSTVGEIVDVARGEGVSVPPKSSIASILDRGCKSETERIFKLCGQRNVGKRLMNLYGLHEW